MTSLSLGFSVVSDLYSKNQHTYFMGLLCGFKEQNSIPQRESIVTYINKQTQTHIHMHVEVFYCGLCIHYFSYKSCFSLGNEYDLG